ncbi:hypothetical protein CONLIGDRAFT_139103 [Coniochaeta ligniaria NRRL 30616]|uniref:Uncharacterized protein n=1 Tax=Coniochaeta ligniaria NRRL 30616 TaxID=1408157 RepID=A0A1J7J826_9PEZI|nr:hypothetical protein CONLIGDRAFT_139103 [Coniochaeta ligniaria NRRL 30616]
MTQRLSMQGHVRSITGPNRTQLFTSLRGVHSYKTDVDQDSRGLVSTVIASASTSGEQNIMACCVFAANKAGDSGPSHLELPFLYITQGTWGPCGHIHDLPGNVLHGHSAFLACLPSGAVGRHTTLEGCVDTWRCSTLQAVNNTRKLHTDRQSCLTLPYSTSPVSNLHITSPSMDDIRCGLPSGVYAAHLATSCDL